MISKVEIGVNAPNVINVIIEIPANGNPVKYEIDKKTGALFVDRLMSTPMHYPCNYGYIPQTLSDDGDPADALVITPYPLISGSVIPARPVGILDMTDEAGEDTKIICVPADNISQLYLDIKEFNQLPKLLLDQIKHFFNHYKDLEPNKWVKIQGFRDSQAAILEILRNQNNYKKAL